MNKVPLSELVGKKIIKVTGLEKNSTEIHFYTASNNHYVLEHNQDCCEYVRLVDLEGGYEDLVDSYVHSFEEVKDTSPDNYNYREDKSYEWTFYKIETSKGGVWLRWLGETDSSYAIGVSFYKE